MNAQRLNRIISNREWLKSQKNLLEMYASLTPKQRSELKELFKNKNGIIKK